MDLLLQQKPGLLFVLATLLPLASFLFLMLVSGAWCLLRPYRNTPWGAALYHYAGGDLGGRWYAYVALGAITLALVCSLAGFLWYNNELYDYEYRIAEQEHFIQQLEEEGAASPQLAREKERLHQLEERWEYRQEHGWSGSIRWIALTPGGLSDPDRGTELNLGFQVDTLTCLMFVMVTLVASLIHLFSIGYMSEENAEEVEDHFVHKEFGHLQRRGRFGRFFMYLSLFCFSMLNLVLANNLLQVFISWELVGICSYLLIGFYYERNTASNAANKAFITNRIGDAGFILGMIILWTYVGTFNFEELFSRVRSPMVGTVHEGEESTKLERAGKLVRANLVEGDLGEEEGTWLQVTEEGQGGSQLVLFPAQTNLNEENPGHFHGVFTGAQVHAPPNPRADEYGSMPYWMLVAAGLGIFLGCVGKSAQFPLQVWLPDAMEGPTPVSALIHAATMVAAGVYLVGRVYPLFTPEVLLVIAYVGGITLFMAATIAVVMTDIKKVLAYSTVSQLGYMMLALGVGGWVAGLFHLLTHAFFKALLFLCSGSVIYGCHHEQDMLRMGGLYPKMKITALTMLMGVLAISGIPLFSGWYSKDSIVAQSMGFAMVHKGHMLLFLLPLVTAGITAFYMFRMWYLTFLGTPRDEEVHEHAQESPWTMTVPLIVLAVFSVCVAWGWPLWDATTSQLEHNLHHAQPVSVVLDFGHIYAEGGEGETWPGALGEELSAAASVRQQMHVYHNPGGFLALGLVVIGIGFASIIYLWGYLDPAEASEQFPGVHAFLMNKWGFDDLYSVAVVRPALVVAGWCKRFDLRVIDGIIHGVAWLAVQVSRFDGWIDNRVVDGLVNVIGDVTYGLATRLRGVQTGYLRSYLLFLVLATAGIFVLLWYFVARVVAG
jgi:NADH-quinone oxidoreductase subunit L